MRTAGGIVGLLIAVVLVVAVIQPAINRARRTQSFPGIVSTGPVHVDREGRPIVVDRGGGQALAVDTATGASTVILDGLLAPRAADVDADGVACAADQGPGLADSPTLRCSNAREIDLGAVPAANPDGLRPDLADVVSDGATGWFVSDAGRSLVLHVDPAGLVSIAATFDACGGRRAATPGGLAVGGDGQLSIALHGDQVATYRGEAIRGCGGSMWVGGGTVRAVIPRRSIPIVLVQESRTGTGTILWHPGLDAADTTILSGIESPRGAALLPDGRIALSAADTLIVYDPATLPGT